MDKKIDTLYDLCEMTFKELEPTKRELENAGGQLDEQHIEYLKDLTEMLKDIKCVIGMMEDEEEGYSGNYYDDDMSMARGGRGGRSNRGRYTRRAHTSVDVAIVEAMDAWSPAMISWIDSRNLWTKLQMKQLARNLRSS